jgi:hypothetical protein
MGKSPDALQNRGNHCQPAGLMNPAPERSSPRRMRNPPGKNVLAE